MKKHVIKKAFTLLELMVIMTVMTILLAAMSPMFTGRSNPSSDVVWHYINGDRNNNIYSNPLNSYLKSGFYIGIAPDIFDITLMDVAKLTIRPTERLNQPQIELHYDNDQVASIFANSENTLFGGKYNKIITNASTKPENSSNSYGNTAYGINALTKISRAHGNTALGYNALTINSDYNQHGNTAVGVFEKNITPNNYAGDIDSTFVGAFSGNDLGYGAFNTIIGNNDGVNTSTSARDNTIIGTNAAPKIEGYENTIIGSYAAPNLTTGKGNTIIGPASYIDNDGATIYRKLKYGSYNTLIGANSGLGLGESASNKTCIGYGSCPIIDEYKDLNLLDDNVSRTFIGGPPRYAEGSPDFGGYAVLEVHNSSSKNAKRNRRLSDGSKHTLNSVGDESVIVNGNLIVRGQAYLGGVPSIIFGDNFENDDRFPLYGMSYDWLTDSTNPNKRAMVLYAKDGSEVAKQVFQYRSAPDAETSYYSPFLEVSYPQNKVLFNHRNHCTCAPEHTSYDWSAPIRVNSNNVIYKSLIYNTYYNVNSLGEGGWYSARIESAYGKDDNYYIDRSRNNSQVSYDDGKVYYKEEGSTTKKPIKLYAYNYAHLPSINNNEKKSCCPYFVWQASDSRLKNIGTEFKDGLDKIKQLKVFNYTFKSDPNKTHNVGVIAQSLKKVFPNAVFKGKDGYYSIRWDEMFYAAINAVKEINSRVETLANRVNKDIERVKALKSENAQLAKKLEELANEITELENRK